MKLSIITINYNHKEGLERTIVSVVSQSCHDFEWIIIDGGSNDGSKDAIENASECVNDWVSEKDNGIYNAMNKGVLKSHGDYLLFLNSGDVLYDSKVVERFHSLIFDADLIVGRLCKNIKNKIVIEPNYSSNRITLADILLHPVPHQATFIKRTLLNECGLYDESFRIVSDWKFFIQAIVVKNATIKLIDCPISIFECNGVSENNSNLNNKERETMLGQFFPQRILDDYQYILSLKETQKNKITKSFYSLLYRLAIFINQKQ